MQHDVRNESTALDTLAHQQAGARTVVIAAVRPAVRPPNASDVGFARARPGGGGAAMRVRRTISGVAERHRQAAAHEAAGGHTTRSGDA